MKKLEIEVSDEVHASLDGWRLVEGIACDKHGLAMFVLFRPAEFAAVQAHALTQTERYALLHCAIERYQSVIRGMFGVTILPLQVLAVQLAIPTPPPTPAPPAKPSTDPQVN